MRLGTSSPLQHTSPEEWAKRHRELGLGAVNFPCTCNDPEEKIMAYAKAAKENDLVIAEVGVWRNTLAADKAEREANIAYAVKQLQMADRIGAKTCVNIVGTPHGPKWDGGYAANFSKETWDMAVASVQEIIDRAKPVNTTYSIETMPWMVPSDPDEYVEFMKAVNRKELGVHLDFINMVNSAKRYFFAEDFLEDIFNKLSGKIISCHLKDTALLDGYTFQLRECACGEGGLPLRKYIELAEKENPEMPMIIEHLDSDEAYLKSIAYVKKLVSC